MAILIPLTQSNPSDSGPCSEHQASVPVWSKLELSLIQVHLGNVHGTTEVRVRHTFLDLGNV